MAHHNYRSFLSLYILPACTHGGNGRYWGYITIIHRLYINWPRFPVLAMVAEDFTGEGKERFI